MVVLNLDSMTETYSATGSSPQLSQLRDRETHRSYMLWTGFYRLADSLARLNFRTKQSSRSIPNFRVSSACRVKGHLIVPYYHVIETLCNLFPHLMHFGELAKLLAPNLVWDEA